MNSKFLAVSNKKQTKLVLSKKAVFQEVRNWMKKVKWNHEAEWEKIRSTTKEKRLLSGENKLNIDIPASVETIIQRKESFREWKSYEMFLREKYADCDNHSYVSAWATIYYNQHHGWDNENIFTIK